MISIPTVDAVQGEALAAVVQAAGMVGVLTAEQQTRPSGGHGPVPKGDRASELECVQLRGQVGEFDQGGEWENAGQLLQPQVKGREKDDGDGQGHGLRAKNLNGV
jgi:hypothetical protein